MDDKKSRILKIIYYNNMENLKEIILHLGGIINDVDRMTSANFMHNKNSIKLRAKIIKGLLEKYQKTNE
jgi:hypothetical protein